MSASHTCRASKNSRQPQKLLLAAQPRTASHARRATRRETGRARSTCSFPRRLQASAAAQAYTARGTRLRSGYDCGIRARLRAPAGAARGLGATSPASTAVAARSPSVWSPRDPPSRSLTRSTSSSASTCWRRDSCRLKIGRGGRRPAAKARSRSDAERRGPAGRRRPPGLEGELSISVGAMSGQSQNCSRLGGMMFGSSRNNHVC